MRSKMILAVAALVMACSEAPTSAVTERPSFTHLTPDPFAPSNFTATATTSVQGQATAVDFTWTDNTTNESRFQVFGFNGAQGKGATTSTPANATSATSSWGPGTWTFRVRAQIGTNGDGEPVWTAYADSAVVVTLCGRKC